MIPILSGVRVWLAAGHTDMRRGFDGLGLVVQETLRRDPHTGHLFVFRGRRADLIKVLSHDGQDLCLLSKRLERGRFPWCSPADGTVTITPAQQGYPLEEINWRIDLLRGRYCWRIRQAKVGAIISLVNADWRVWVSGVWGNCYDNSMVETFFKTPEGELVWRTVF